MKTSVLIGFYSLCMVISSIAIGGCSSSNVAYNNVIDSQYDISENGDRILFTYFKNNIGEIREIDLKTMKIRLVVNIPQVTCIKPKYINNTDIVFISTKGDRNRKVSNVCLMIDGKVTSVVRDIPYDVEAIFSISDKRLYVSIPRYYGHYSPIVSSRSHEYDIFSFAIDGSDKKIHTKLNAYSMGNLHLHGELLYFEAEKLYEYNIKTSTLKEVFSKNSAYYYALSPDLKSVVYSMPINTTGMYQYELHITNIASGETSQLTKLHKSVGIPQFCSQNSVVFLCQENQRNVPERFAFYKINTDGTGLVKLYEPQ